jgi:hypothetical protein
MGCLKTIGCLALVIVLLGVGFLGRGLWMPKLRDSKSEPVTATSTWQPLTQAGAARAQRVLQQLSQQDGPRFVSVPASELVAYIVQQLSSALPESADSIEAAAINDRICVRAIVKTGDFADRKSLGPLAMMLGEREPVSMCGVINILSPGKGELQVKEFKVRELGIPGPAIPRLIRQMSPPNRPEELSDDGLPLETPVYIGDVTVRNGQVVISRQARTQ